MPLPKRNVPLRTKEEQSEARKQVGLPPHFCTEVIFAHNVKPLPSQTQQQEKRKVTVWVKEHKNARPICWNPVERSGQFLLRNGGTVNCTTTIKFTLEQLRRITTDHHTDYYHDQTSQLYIRVEDVRIFLNLLQKK